MRWSNDPAPIWAAPDWSARIGVIMRRASASDASTDSTKPMNNSNPVRSMDALSAANASERGCSTSTAQPSGAIAA